MDSRWIHRLWRVEMPKYKGKKYDYDAGGMKAYRAAKMADKKKRKPSKK